MTSFQATGTCCQNGGIVVKSQASAEFQVFASLGANDIRDIVPRKDCNNLVWHVDVRCVFRVSLAHQSDDDRESY